MDYQNKVLPVFFVCLFVGFCPYNVKLLLVAKLFGYQYSSKYLPLCSVEEQSQTC